MFKHEETYSPHFYRKATRFSLEESMSVRIYLDYNATAKIRPEVIDALANSMSAVGNASSVHTAGRSAKIGRERAWQVADLVGASPEQVSFHERWN